MNLIGMWEGIWFLSGLRPYMEDESFQLEILSVSDKKMHGKMNINSSRGIGKDQCSKLLSYRVNGDLEKDRIILIGIEQGEEVCLELMLHLDTLTGDYYFTSAPWLRATVELKKHQPVK